jgi:hypothetical protein
VFAFDPDRPAAAANSIEFKLREGTDIPGTDFVCALHIHVQSPSLDGRNHSAIDAETLGANGFAPREEAHT